MPPLTPPAPPAPAAPAPVPAPQLLHRARSALYDSDDALERAIDYLQRRLRHEPHGNLRTALTELQQLRPVLLKANFALQDALCPAG